MTSQNGQNFENHVLIPKPWMATQFFMLIGLILTVVGLFLVKSTMGLCLIGTGLLLNTLGSMYGLFLARSYSTTLQDRIIRAEMRTRLENSLPDDLKEKIPTLTMSQVIALRFASDEELIELVGKVVEGGITDRKSIKQMVKNWQGDYARV